MLPLTLPQYAASGNIRPCRWIIADGTATAAEATDATKPLLGLSNERTRYVPGSPADDGFVAIAGEPVPYHGPFQIANAIAGAVTTINAPQTSDGSGRSIDAVLTTSATIYWIGGIALDAALEAGDKIRVWILSPMFLKTS